MIRLIARLGEPLLGAADLLIDFLTLGEYGLEAAEPEAVPRALRAPRAEPSRRLAA